MIVFLGRRKVKELLNLNLDWLLDSRFTQSYGHLQEEYIRVRDFLAGILQRLYERHEL